jgi:hypothetical protein
MSDEIIKNPPSDDAYPIVSTLFVNKRFDKHEIMINSLSLTILDLIKKDQIKCEINWEDSHSVGKKLTETDLEVMKSITLRIANKGELKTSESLVIKLLKTMNKNKKFNLKDMIKQSRNPAIANKFGEDFIEFKTAIEKENNYTSKDYKDIMANGKFTPEGKELQKEWDNFQKYLKSQDLTEKYPPESTEENSSQIIYGACFNIEKDVLQLRENDSVLSDFIDKDGYKLLNIIFNNALSHVSEKHKGDGIFYGVNDKYTIPGGA